MKYLKLLLIAVLIGLAAWGISALVHPSVIEGGGRASGSSRQHYWQEQISDLCQSSNLTKDGYSTLAFSIGNDCTDARNIKKYEMTSLLNSLEAEACAALEKQVVDLFRGDSYPASTVKRLKDLRSYLLSELKNSGSSNSSLTRADRILNHYDRIVRLLNYNSRAAYSDPLESFDSKNKPSSPDSRASEIKNLSSYDDCFKYSKYVADGIRALGDRKASAELEYYTKLEEVIEEHFMKEADGSDDMKRDFVRCEQQYADLMAESLLSEELRGDLQRKLRKFGNNNIINK